jgi:hypothetical protein
VKRLPRAGRKRNSLRRRSREQSHAEHC